MTIKTLTADIPEGLRSTLQEIICWQCEGCKGGGEYCDWRRNDEFCDVVEPAVELIHEAYWKYQMKELKGVS